MKVAAILAFLATALPVIADEAVDQFLSGMKEAYAEMGNVVGLDAAQNANVAEIEKSYAEQFKQNPALALDPKLREEAIAKFEALLTPEQRKKMKTFLAESVARGNQIHSASNLRQIGMAAQLHANLNRGILPADIGTLLKREIDADAFISRNSKKELPKDFVNKSEKEKIEWINQNTDYIYVGAGRNLHKDPTFVVAYEKPEVSIGGCNFLLSDGSVNLETNERSAKIIAELKAGNNPPMTKVGEK